MIDQELRELYQEVILDHGRRPRNLRRPARVTHTACGHNPLCGDQLNVYLTVAADGRIQDVAFQGRGCAISVASASLMTEVLRGKTMAQAQALFGRVHAMCAGADDGAPAGAEADDLAAEVERLEVLAGVREFPMRVKCATLAWHTMKAAFAGGGEVNTEEEA